MDMQLEYQGLATKPYSNRNTGEVGTNYFVDFFQAGARRFKITEDVFKRIQSRQLPLRAKVKPVLEIVQGRYEGSLFALIDVEPVETSVVAGRS